MKIRHNAIRFLIGSVNSKQFILALLKPLKNSGDGINENNVKVKKLNCRYINGMGHESLKISISKKIKKNCNKYFEYNIYFTREKEVLSVHQLAIAFLTF